MNIVFTRWRRKTPYRQPARPELLLVEARNLQERLLTLADKALVQQDWDRWYRLHRLATKAHQRWFRRRAASERATHTLGLRQYLALLFR